MVALSKLGVDSAMQVMSYTPTDFVAVHGAELPDGEAMRHDEEFAYVAAWEYAGDNKTPVLNKEPLTFENVELSVRSYK